MKEPIRILVADDATLLRDLLVKTLQEQPWLEVVGEARDGQGAIDLAGRLEPDVLLLDIEMPGMTGLEALPKLRQQFPGMKVIMLSGCDALPYIQKAKALGAHGYCVKANGFVNLLQAIASVQQGKLAFMPAQTDTDAIPLTKRQQEVGRSLLAGKTCSQMAETLGLRENTVKRHKESLMKKLGIHTVLELNQFRHLF